MSTWRGFGAILTLDQTVAFNNRSRRMSRIDFSHLTPQERLDLAGDLLDSVGEADAPLSAELRAELDRRDASFAQARAQAIPWAEVRGRLRPSNR